MLERIEYYVHAKNIIANSIISDSNSPLSLAGLYSIELSDVVFSSRIEWIATEDISSLLKSKQQVRISLGESAHVTFE